MKKEDYHKLRRSERLNKGVLSRIEDDNKEDNESDNGRSMISQVSRTVSHSSKLSERTANRRKLEAKLKAEKELKELEDAEIERKKKIINLELEVEHARIEEEELGEEMLNLVENKYEELPDNKSQKEEATIKWLNEVSRIDDNLPLKKSFNQQGSDITTALINAVNALATQKRHSPKELNKFMARQVTNFELPIFWGNPQDWPAFHSEFKESTESCNLTPRENILRLRKCLKGEAREAVKGLLINPESVEEIIRLLELRFGRPDQIMHSLFEEISTLPPIKENYLEPMLKLASSVKHLVVNLELLNMQDQLPNLQILEEIKSKLPINWQIEWIRNENKSERKLNLKDLADWLLEQSLIVSKTLRHGKQKKEIMKLEPEKKERYISRFKKETTLTAVATDKQNCVYCKKTSHLLYKCRLFEKINLEEKWKFVKENNLCFVCLQLGHVNTKCWRKDKKCKVDGCSRHHHKMLHRSNNVEENKVETNVLDNKKFGETVNFTSGNYNKVLLKIAPVVITGLQGECRTYALFDEASSVSLIHTNLAEKLGMSGPSSPLRIRWTNNENVQEIDSKTVKCKIKGENCKREYNINNLRTMDNLDLPVQSVNIKRFENQWKHLSNENNILPYENAKPTILIGQDNWELIVSRQVIQGPKNTPALSRTNLGWIIHGRIGKNPHPDERICFIKETDNDLLHQLIKDSFSIENFGVMQPTKSLMSNEDERALEIMKKTARKIDNHWEVCLPWKHENTVLPESKSNSFRRLKFMEKKMDQDSNFAMKYCEKIEDYLFKGYARKLTYEEACVQPPHTWYLPHFGVINPNKPGKLRFVFDAAVKNSGMSLNDTLLKGPDLVASLIETLFNFRQKKIAFAGDIKEMFHQVNIRKEDQDAQRFLWRGMDRNREPDVYVMQAMIFGAVSSPFIAQYIKNMNAEKHADKYPEAYEAIKHHHYVDDYLDSTNTEEEAVKLINEVRKVHEKGGFELRNWICNSQVVLDSIPADLHAEVKKLENDKFSEIRMEKILGLFWNSKEDILQFSINFNRVEPELINNRRLPTKREVLRIVMSLYDPLGLIAHFTIHGRIIIQDIWRDEYNWDDTINNILGQKWTKWLHKIQDLKNLKIERPYCQDIAEAMNIQLHIFADASQQAYAAAAYIRVETRNKITVNLIMAKARVIPIKGLTIPRAELQGAVLASRIAKLIKNGHSVKFESIIFWTDSQTVLKWLKTSTKKHPVYISHRVGEILENTNVGQWRWVPSKENVADEATRDEKQPDLTAKSRWLNGPEFLKLCEENWPQKTEVEEIFENKITETEINMVTIEQISLINITRFSKYERLWRMVGWLLRSIKKFKKLTITQKTLSVEELQEAERILLKIAQLENFPEEYTNLNRGEALKRNSKIINLSPYIEDDLIKMKGRTCLSKDLLAETKNPIILDSSHPITQLLVEYYHRKMGHIGQETVLSELRKKFWVIRGRQLIKKIKRNCFHCKIKNTLPQAPIMGNLPAARITSEVKPFTYTGMDYFGPLEVTMGRKRLKRYGVIFTCLVIRAVHLEIASDLTTNATINAIRRFICRRGAPKEIYSDNGTNLRGANEELKQAIQTMNEEQICNELAMKGIKWRFNPPAAPHMGGSWERMVQSVKKALMTILKCKAPKEEVLHTLLCEAEDMVNSRPITRISEDPDDLTALTPNHLLKGIAAETAPGIFYQKDISVNNWKAAQSLAEEFWRRWIKEYLPTLNKRSKWNKETIPIKENDMVILLDENVARNEWKKGIVIKLYISKDNRIRMVDVRTITGTYKRPVVKVCNIGALNGFWPPGTKTGGENVAD